MRQVVLYQLLSLDGVAEEPGDWVFDVDPELVDHLGEVIGRQDDVLLGRTTYDYWAGYWPTSHVQPFADFVNGVRKHVATSTSLTRPWANSSVVAGPVIEHVAALKRRDGGDIGLHGSATLARHLLRAGLVDELRLVLAPALAGHGRRLFGEDERLHRFELVDVVRTSSGLVLLHHRLLGAS
ncbi:dihydrofolate reductase family protein [Modestobacter sp. L9-4]|uniref:dihydrofolate reductase family protein n=1 Tax=Modestobacter sp. L9-4 TaxID=2851567 RepID=UPI001F37E7DA|nr:dihydrofolate reductase family protein [Modestobacter sp. L9-4]